MDNPGHRIYISSLHSTVENIVPVGLRVTEENKSPNLLALDKQALCPFFGVAQKVTYARGSAKLCRPFRALKLRLILRQHQNPAHFGGFIFFRNP